MFACFGTLLRNFVVDYPKDYRENMEARRKLLIECSEDMAYRSKVKELFFRDPLFAFNLFFYTLDIRKRPFQCQPFCTYSFQDDAILELVEAINSATGLKTQDVVWEKSRDMGASWMIILVFKWLWLNPEKPADFLLGSRVQDYVDRIGDPRTLFHKLRYNLDKLPYWLLPEGFNRRLHDNFMKLENPESGATITGESNNPNFSTGGRYTAILFDEFAKWEATDEAAWTDAGDATPCRVANSTPFGAAGKYYNLATDGKTRKITMHWSLHPEKSEGLYCVWPKPEEADEVVDEYHWVGLRSPWYDLEVVRRTELEIAQNLDIDYIGAGSPIFDGRAGKRVAALLRSTREPRFYEASEDGQTLEPVSNVSDYVDYVQVYAEPRLESNYLISVDVAEGKEVGDYSVVKVLERESETVVATFASRVNEVELAKYVAAITRHYTFDEKEDEPWWAVETNGPGLATFDILVEIYDLPNPFMMPKFDVALQKASYRKGWWTAVDSRRKLVGGIKEWLIQGEGWCDPRCCREMTTFVRSKTGVPKAKPGTFDDEVMCFGIALQVNRIAPFEDYVEPEEPKVEFQDFVSPRPLGDPNGTLEERCFASLMRKRQLADSPDLPGSIIEQLEGY
jgi:hypothetical protein